MRPKRWWWPWSGAPHLPSDLLRMVSDKAEGNPLFVEEITISLLERGLLTRGEREVIFKHAFTQDVAYQSHLALRRRELHESIGRAIEDLYGDRLEEQATILAYHYARSDRQDKAIEYALLAGDRAARLYANAEARTYYEEALSGARALPTSDEAQRWQIDAALKLAAVALT